MDNPIVISLVVSGIGMLMLFLALAFLYGLMYLMTALVKDRPEGEVEANKQETGSKKQEARIMKQRAAVVAVALARAELELNAIGAAGAEETISAWRALHHQRQLTLNLPTRRAR
jgi:Na+-transporting methylmalonyl-CoA/oxaloacetate decarboxylase gamma subunit